jgi:alkaline phosphatase
VDWIDDPNTPSTWYNSLVIVTADHETGYLTSRPGVFPNQQLGEINTQTLLLEKANGNTGLRASWQDTDQDNLIDSNEEVYWAWNSTGHTNSLVPLFVKGVGAELFDSYNTWIDPVRGTYLDNTDIYQVAYKTAFETPDTLAHCLFLPLIQKGANSP